MPQIDQMLFDGGQGLLRVALVGVLAYAALVLLLRVSGKRTLAKMNAFDLVVTVALGSTLATILLSKDVALAEGVLAFLVLVALQFVVAWSSVRFPWFDDLVKSEPRLLLRRGAFLHAALRAERVTEGEVRAALRSQGHASVAAIDAVILETDGSFSVIADAGASEHPTLSDVRGADE
jgi:uncharacterized membrane protein YcaP (DUF421 family)